MSTYLLGPRDFLTPMGRQGHCVWKQRFFILSCLSSLEKRRRPVTAQTQTKTSNSSSLAKTLKSSVINRFLTLYQPRNTSSSFTSNTIICPGVCPITASCGVTPRTQSTRITPLINTHSCLNEISLIHPVLAMCRCFTRRCPRHALRAGCSPIRRFLVGVAWGLNFRNVVKRVLDPILKEPYLHR